MSSSLDTWALIAGDAAGEPRRVYTVVEHKEIDIPLSELLVDARFDIYEDHSKYLNVALRQGAIVVRATGYVGLIPINDRVAIEVCPRVPISNLGRVLCISGHPPIPLERFARDYASSDDGSPSLLQYYARALILTTNYIDEYGLHREYHQQQADSSFPRGRVRLAESYRRHWARGHPDRVTSQWFEQTVDTTVNRCIKYALWLMGEQYRSIQTRGSKEIARLLNARYDLLSRVELDRSTSFLHDRYVQRPDELPSMRSYYRDAINVAVAVIQNRGVSYDSEGRELAIPSLLLEMDKVFEKYVLGVLRGYVHDHVPNAEVLDGKVSGEGGGRKYLFDDNEAHEADPDIVVRLREAHASVSTYPLICDAKYKAKPPERDDINQVIAYAVSYEAPVAVIVYATPKSGVGGLASLGRIGGRQLFQYGLNLSANDIVAEEIAYAQTLVGLAGLG